MEAKLCPPSRHAPHANVSLCANAHVDCKMGELPGISGKQCVAVLLKAGFAFHRQEGIHIILRKQNSRTLLFVPDHDELDKAALRAVIKYAKISIYEFIKLLSVPETLT